MYTQLVRSPARTANYGLIDISLKLPANNCLSEICLAPLNCKSARLRFDDEWKSLSLSSNENKTITKAIFRLLFDIDCL